MSKVELDREPWIDVIGSSLREAEAPVPPEGWERLERALRTPAVPLYRRWWTQAAAAAVLLAAVTWSLRIQLPTPEPTGPLAEHPVAEEERLLVTSDPELAEDHTETPAKGYADADAPVPAADLSPVNISTADLLAANMSPANVSAEDASAEEVSAEGVSAEDASAKTAAAEDEPAPAAARLDRSAAASEGAAVPESKASAVERTQPRPFRPAVRRHRSVSFGLAMSGGITLSGGTGRSGAMLLPASLFMQSDAPVMTDDVATNTVYENGRLWVKSPMEEWSYDHRVPLSFGFTVSRELTAGVSLASGVHYTLLYSEVTVSPQSARLRQRLHFIGIPVRVETRFLRRSDFSLYAGAGVMAEKCVGGRLGDRTVKIPSVQWSVGASVGAQYALGNHAAIYFEPDLSYYLTRSELRTVRTDSPLTLSLRLGVKLTY